MTYVYEIVDRTVTITRRQIGTAYARNGNAGNPTRYFAWDAAVEGRTVATSCTTRASAYEHALAAVEGHRYYDHPNYPNRWVNVRPWTIVRDEMKANYRKATR